MPLPADSDSYKMFLNDTWLFITLAFKDKDIIENIIYQKLLNDKLSADLGYVYENMMAFPPGYFCFGLSFFKRSSIALFWLD